VSVCLPFCLGLQGPGNAAVVQLLLDAGADVQARTASDATALHIAACSNSGDVVRALVKAGGNARDNRAYKGGSTAATTAAAHGLLQQHVSYLIHVDSCLPGAVSVCICKTRAMAMYWHSSSQLSFGYQQPQQPLPLPLNLGISRAHHVMHRALQ
jgi:hypothetical protein